MRIQTSTLAAAATCLVVLATFAPAAAPAQPILAQGLDHPYKVDLTPGGNLLVAESGTGTHDGRVLMIAPHGRRHVLLSGLPSATVPQGDVLGPTAVADAHRTLYVLIGEGDVTEPAPPGTQVPNTAGLSSPIFSSILRAEFDPVPDGIRTGFHLDAGEMRALSDGHEVHLENDAGERVSLLVLTDFRDLEPDEVLGVRQSNPFALILHGSLTAADLEELGLSGTSLDQANFQARLEPGTAAGKRLRERTRLWVADSGMNTVLEVQAGTGRHRVLTRFPPLPNPLFPDLGPPVLEPVPTGLHLREDGDLLVTLLAGFPFPPGSAGVYRVDRATGAFTPWIEGLSSATDVLELAGAVYVLEVSADLLGGQPGRILRVARPGAAPEIVADGLIVPAGMTHDPVRNELLVTEAVTGMIKRIALD